MSDQTPDMEKKTHNDVSNSSRSTLNKEALVSYLFLIGSLMFVLDSILENMASVSFSSELHLTASILFTIGSVLFIPNNSEN